MYSNYANVMITEWVMLLSYINKNLSLYIFQSYLVTCWIKVWCYNLLYSRIVPLDCLLPLPTVHTYSPSSLPVTVRVLLYSAVSVSTIVWENIWLPSSSITDLSLVQLTVVVGPPVEVQVRLNWGGSALGAERSLKLMVSATTGAPENKVMSIQG